jgi:polyketide biosynthesis acyl carrier protein
VDRQFIVSKLFEQILIVVPDLQDVPMNEQSNLADLGIDSVDRQEILILTLEAINLELPMVQIHGKRNIGELADFFFSKKAA